MAEPEKDPAKEVKRKLDQKIAEVEQRRAELREESEEAETRAERLIDAAATDQWKSGDVPEDPTGESR